MATIKKAGNIRVKRSQIEMIVEAIERNPLLNGYQVSSTYTAAKRHEDWEELSRKLNGSGGAIKSVRAWQKTWADKKGEVKKKVKVIKQGRNKDSRLSTLEERIAPLIPPDATDRAEKEESESMPKGPVILKVEHCPDAPVTESSYIMAISQALTQESVSGSSYIMATSLPCTQESANGSSYIMANSQACTQESASGSSYIMTTSLPLTEESNQTDLEESLQPDTPSRLPDTEESHQPKSLPTRFMSLQSKIPQDRLPSSSKRIRTKSVVLKSDNAQKLVEGQTEMARALTRCAESLEKHNEIQERALEIEERKAELQERALEIEERKANIQERALEMERRKADVQERALEIEKRRADAEERDLKIKKQKADAFTEILCLLQNKFL